MIGKGIRRFYKTVTVSGDGGAFVVELDGKPVKTPRRSVLSVPTHRLALAIAEEWRAQEGTLDPAAMPQTALAFAAVDTVATHQARISEEILAYARTDLLCYRAEAPVTLVERQSAAWDPLLDWAANALGVKLLVGKGIAFVEQPSASLNRLADLIDLRDAFGLAALHGATAITGSLIVALAIAEGRLDATEAFALSHLDETFQSESWGIDAEAAARRRRLQSDLEAIEHFLHLVRP